VQRQGILPVTRPVPRRQHAPRFSLCQRRSGPGRNRVARSPAQAKLGRGTLVRRGPLIAKSAMSGAPGA